jgi:predicted membrane channel-forming protein YqfA (hemolysin III family)
VTKHSFFSASWQKLSIKKFFMKKTDYFGFALLIAGMAAGIWIGGFNGGGLFGIFLSSFCFAAVGLVLRMKAAARMKRTFAEKMMDSIDKKINDRYADSENN